MEAKAEAAAVVDTAKAVITRPTEVCPTPSTKEAPSLFARAQQATQHPTSVPAPVLQARKEASAINQDKTEKLKEMLGIATGGSVRGSAAASDRCACCVCYAWC